MGVIAEFGADPDQFVLGSALLEPAIERVEFERVVPAWKSVMPFFWVWGAEFQSFECRAEEEPAVSSVSTVDTFEDGRLYRAEWKECVPGFVRTIRRSSARMIEGHGDEDGWNFELMFASQDGLATFNSLCTENGLPFSLEQFVTFSSPAPDAGYGLTPKQREILVMAVEQGYFREPRDVSLEELAEQLGISAPSASGRLRRATHHLLETTVLDE